MRIAICTDTFPPEVNGVANAAFHSARALTRAGPEGCVFTVSKLGAKELEAMGEGTFRVETIPSIGLPIYLGVRATPPVGLALGKMRRFKPDVIHSHTPFSMGWEAVWAARMLGVPLVGTHHTFFNHYLEHVHLNYSWAERLSWKLTVGYYNRCDLVVSPTRSLAGELLTQGLKRPYEVLANTIDTELFRPAPDAAARKKLKAALGYMGPTLVYMGRVSYEKSIDQAIRAFGILARDIPDAQFLVVGDGPEKSALEQLAHSLGLSKRVRFLGFVFGEELVEVLQASDVFITASKSENMPLAVLEAMACGLPILAVRSLGLAEIVEDGKNGALLPPDDVEALAGKALALFRDDTLRLEQSRASRELSATYSEEAITQRLQTIYTDAVRRHAAHTTS